MRSVILGWEGSKEGVIYWDKDNVIQAVELHLDILQNRP